MLDLDFFKDVGKSAMNVGRGVVDFFRSPSMDTVKDVGSAVVSVGSAIRSASSDFKATPPTGLADTQTHPTCLLYTSPSPRDGLLSRMPSSA